MGRTNLHARHEVAEASERVEHGEHAYKELRKAHTGVNEDEKTVEALDPDGKLRAEGAPAEASHGEQGGHEAAAPTGH